MTRNFIGYLVLLASMCACSTAPEEPAPSAASGSRPPVSPVAAPAATGAGIAPTDASLPGYVHTVAASKFAIGQPIIEEVSVPTMRRWRGSQGAFGLDPTTGATMGVLDANAQVGPYMADSAGQGQLVRAYFVNAGLPADQIESVKATWHVEGGGLMAAPLNSEAPPLKFVNSVLHRAVNGVPIVESYAAARMTAAGDVGWEAVYWPAIDMSVVDAAVSFAGRLADSSTLAAFRAKLPGTPRHEAGVVIHHTTPAIHGTPQAFVSYDVTLDAASSAVDRHFDQNGIEFRLPQETSGPGTPRH